MAKKAKKYSTSKRAVAARKKRAAARRAPPRVAPQPPKFVVEELTRLASLIQAPPPSPLEQPAYREVGMEVQGLVATKPVPSQVTDPNPMAPVPTQALIAGRQSTHGDFRHNATTSQRGKAVVAMAVETSGVNLSDTQQEALDMIAHKIGRITAGNPNEADHWRDIAGYATLVANEIETGKPVL